MEANATDGLPDTGFGDLSLDVVSMIGERLACNGRDLLQLGRTCHLGAEVAQDPQLWRKLSLIRFGAGVLPADSAAVVPLDGWTFFPGLDSVGQDIVNRFDLKDQPAALLALVHEMDRDAAASSNAGIKCFNTQGSVKYDVRPRPHWERFSYEPGQGMYVRASLGLKPPPPAALSPPAFPGWTFYHSASPGNNITSRWVTDDFRDERGALELLHAAAEALPDCLAFSTEGHLKHDLVPQSQWATLRSTFHGMWVRDGTVADRQMAAPGVVDYRRLYFQLAALHQSVAASVGVCWLDGDHGYLERVRGVAGSRSPEVVRLNNVCWLDLATTFQGVAPGCYRAVWRIAFHSSHCRETLNLDATTTASRAAPLATAVAPAGGWPAHTDPSSNRTCVHAAGSLTADQDASDGNEAGGQEEADAVRGPDGAVLQQSLPFVFGQPHAKPGRSAGQPSAQARRTARAASVLAASRTTGAAAVVTLTAEEAVPLSVSGQVRDDDLSDLRAAHESRWFDLCAGPMLLLPEGSVHDVRVSLSSHTSGWKAGLMFDCVELLAVEPPATVAAIAALVLE